MLPDMRGHNEGSLFRRKRDGRWVASVTMADGRRRSAVSPKRSEAAAALAELLRQRDAEAIDPRRIRLGAYLERWVETVQPYLAPATWKQHEGIIRLHLAPALGGHRVAALGVGHVRGYLGRTDLDGQTLRHHRATLRRALQDAVRDGIVTRNVAALAEPPHLIHRQRAVLSADEVRILLDGSREDPMWAFWVLAATTGMRIAEMLGLTWADVDLDGRSLTVNHTLHRIGGEWQLRKPKTDKSRRTIPLTDIAVGALRQHRLRQAEVRLAAGVGGLEGLVFTTGRGHPVHGSNLVPQLYRLERDLGLPRVGIHGLRHSAASMLVAAGVPIEKVAKILGHSSVRITHDLYLHLRPEDIRDAADQMQRLVGDA